MSLKLTRKEHERLQAVLKRSKTCSGPRPNKITPEKEQECIEKYHELGSINQVRKDMAMCAGTVRNILNKHGVVR
jgi:hypothetical protein